jgi:hypothetical protein
VWRGSAAAGRQTHTRLTKKRNNRLLTTWFHWWRRRESKMCSLQQNQALIAETGASRVPHGLSPSLPAPAITRKHGRSQLQTSFPVGRQADSRRERWLVAHCVTREPSRPGAPEPPVRQHRDGNHQQMSFDPKGPVVSFLSAISSPLHQPRIVTFRKPGRSYS